MGIDLIGKEEMLEVESRIEKILGKMPVMEIKSEASNQAEVTPVLEKDITEKAGDEELKDTAVEMNTDKVEEHIAEMFSRPVSDEKVETKVTEPQEEDDEVQIISRLTKDNSVKDVTDCIKEKEEIPVKVPQQNGSK